MASNIIQLPRPQAQRSAHPIAGLYFRAGRNDHVSLLDLMTEGDAQCSGIVFEATNVARHHELLERAEKQRLDTVLDPKTHASATIGGFTERLGALPWGIGRPHTPDDFRGTAGRDRIKRLADFAIEHRFTQVIAPGHLLATAADPWLARDTETSVWLRDELDSRGGKKVQVNFPLAISYKTMRDGLQRKALISAARSTPANAVWLRVDGFGSHARASAVRAFLESCASFHEIGLPFIADHLGGLVGLATIAFGATGGLSHGITLQERFDSSYWRKPRVPGTVRSMAQRVYIPSLDLMLKPTEAKLLFDSSVRAKSTFGCHDRRCCPRGIADMLENPAHHFLYQRVQQVVRLSNVPESMRSQRFLEEHLRPATDHAVQAAGINWTDDQMAKKTLEHRKRLDKLRIMLGEISENHPLQTFAQAPISRFARED